MTTVDFTALVDQARAAAKDDVGSGQVPGETHPTLQGLDLGVCAFDVESSSRAADAHEAICTDPGCLVGETFRIPNVRIMVVEAGPLGIPMKVERNFTTEEARRVAATIWACADIAEEGS